MRGLLLYGRAAPCAAMIDAPVDTAAGPEFAIRVPRSADLQSASAGGAGVARLRHRVKQFLPRQNQFVERRSLIRLEWHTSEADFHLPVQPR